MQLSDDRARTKVYIDRESLPDCTSWISFHGELHPDTDPAAIFVGHCDEVAAAVQAVRDLSRPVRIGLISYIACLPEWNVRRCLESLGVTMASDDAAGKDREMFTEDQFVSLLRKAIGKKSITASEIAKKLGLPEPRVRNFLDSHRDIFEQQRKAKLGEKRHGGVRTTWSVATSKAAKSSPANGMQKYRKSQKKAVAA